MKISYHLGENLCGFFCLSCSTWFYNLPKISSNKTSSPIDLVADQYGFESISALIDYLLAYTPRGPKEERLYEALLAERLVAYIAGQEVDEVPLVDEVPF